VPQAIAVPLIKFLAVTAIQLLYQRHQRRKQQRAAKRVQAVDVEYAGGLEPRRRLYGYFRAAGLNCMPAITTGPNGDHVYKCLAISDGRIDYYSGIWFNNDRIDRSDIVGSIIDGPYETYAFIGFHEGAASQTADSRLMGVPGWSSDHRGDGVAYVSVDFKASNEVWKQGAPTVLAEGRGAWVYDPRLDSAPGADPANPVYTPFTTNPALILADYLIWASGANEQAASVDWNDVVTAADICDELVTIPGSTTQERYTCSVDAYSPQTISERNETLRMLTRAMMGACWFSGGTWHMRAGAYTAPVGTITQDDILDDVKISTASSTSVQGVFNAVRGSFVDGSQNFQPKSFPEVLSSSFEAEDGSRRFVDVEYRTCLTAYEAQRNAIQYLRTSRRTLSVSALFRARCFDFNIYDVVSVTLPLIGWVSQPARIMSMALRQNFTVEIDLQEIDEGDFDDPDPADYTEPGSVSAPESTTYKPGAPRNLSATGIGNGILFTWDAPLDAPSVLLYQLFEYTSAVPFSSATQIVPDTAQNSIIVPRSDTATRYYWVRAKIAETGEVGTQAPPSNGVPGAPLSADGGLAAFVYPGSTEALVYASSASTPEVEVTASGGTAPYTYATSFVSGGTGITINDGTTSSPYFSATGLTEGETRSGTARILVTDNVSATVDTFVTVTISRAYDVVLEDRTISSTGGSYSGGPGGSGAPAISIYLIKNDGDVATHPAGGEHTWKDPGADAADYDVRFTVNSGSLSGGTGGAWLNLADTRSITVSQYPPGTPGTVSANVTVEVRPAGGGATIDSATIVLNATLT
jgi:hypothetical protein